jgi:ribosomal protein S18 acetylase RimI-like enzyme
VSTSGTTAGEPAGDADPASGTQVVYRTDLDGIAPEQLHGFFEGWPNPPTPQTHLRILRGSSAFVLAVDAASGRVVGFVTALSDGVLSAYLPLLEVLPAYRGRGIGRALVRRALAELGDLYMIDVTCDPGIVPFYRALGLRPATAANLRRRELQAGAPGV